MKCIQGKNDCPLFSEPKLAQLKHYFDGKKLRKDTIYADINSKQNLTGFMIQ